jgi:hypothetical protein
MSDHRYWRIYVTAVDGGSAVAFTEIELVDFNSDTVPKPGSVVVTESAAFGGSPGTYDGSKAYDNDTGTLWSSVDGPPEWVAFDFGVGEAYDITEVNITARTGGDEDQAPTAFTVEYSDDGSNWIPYWSVSGSTGWSAGETRNFESGHAADPAHRYWRLYALSNYSDNYITLAEMVLSNGSDADLTTNQGGTASSSSSFSGSYLPANAFDGNNTTKWATSAADVNGAWLKWDFGAANEQDVDTVKLRASNSASETEEYPKEWLFQFSDDDTNWTTVGHFDGTVAGEPSTSEERSFDLFEDVETVVDPIGPQSVTFKFYTDGPIATTSDPYTFKFSVLGGELVLAERDYTFKYALAPIAYPLAFGYIPEIQLAETLEYATAEFESRSRKRWTASLSPYPRRIVTYRIPIEELAENFTTLERYIRDNRADRIAIADWPRMKYIGSIAENATEIAGDFRSRGITAADFVGLYNELTDEITVVFVDSVSSTEMGILYEGTLSAIESASVVPLMLGYFGPQHDFDLSANHGTVEVTFNCDVLNRAELSSVAYTGPTLGDDDYPIFIFPITLPGETVGGFFDTGVEINDTPYSAKNVYQFSDMIEEKELSIVLKKSQLDNFYAFLDTVKGSTKPFYISTNFAAMTLASTPSLGATTITVENGELSEQFSAIQIETVNGISYHTIEDIDGNDIDILPALGGSTGDNDIVKITGLRLAHIVADRVELEHYQAVSYATFSVRDWLA